MLAFFTLTPAPCHGPAPARRRQEKVKRCCSAAWLASTRPLCPGSRQPDFYFFMLASAQPSPAPQPSCRQFPFTLLELVQARGRIATPMCYITIISAPSPATEPWASTPTFILTLIQSQFTLHHFYVTVPIINQIFYVTALDGISRSRYMEFSLVSTTLGCVVLWMCCVGPERESSFLFWFCSFRMEENNFLYS